MKHNRLLTAAGIIFIIVYGIILSFNNDGKNDNSNSKAIPQRVISINPAATEIIFELGFQDKLAGVSDYCLFPAETVKIDKVGGVINPNFERISTLVPDLIIIQGKCDDIVKYCDLKKIDYMNINLRTISEIYDGIQILGDKLGCQSEADILCRKIRSEVGSVKSMFNTSVKKKVFFSLYRLPGSLASITTVGNKTFLSELIEVAGGENVFNDLEQGYPVISKESLLKRQPDIIIEPYTHSGSSMSSKEEVLQDWKMLAKMNAVINNEVYLIDSELVLKPGPRVGKAALELAKLIHPESFSE